MNGIARSLGNLKESTTELHIVITTDSMLVKSVDNQSAVAIKNQLPLAEDCTLLILAANGCVLGSIGQRIHGTFVDKHPCPLLALAVDGSTASVDKGNTIEIQVIFARTINLETSVVACTPESVVNLL